MRLWLLIVLSSTCSAQMMKPQEYRDFIQRMDGSILQWKARMEVLDVEKLNVTYATGKQIADAKEVFVQNMDLVHKLVLLELGHNILSRDIDISDSVQDMKILINDSISGTVWKLPLDLDEWKKFSIPLQQHIHEYATLLQAQADGHCAKSP